ncbi:MAG: hypothetical protein ACOYOK_08880 [Pseudobdellovibrionaceae bacterium]
MKQASDYLFQFQKEGVQKRIDDQAIPFNLALSRVEFLERKVSPSLKRPIEAIIWLFYLDGKPVIGFKPLLASEGIPSEDIKCGESDSTGQAKCSVFIKTSGTKHFFVKNANVANIPVIEVEPSVFEYLENGDDFKGGCGCTTVTSDGKHFAFAEQSADPLTIKNSGKVIHLKFLKTTESKKQEQNPEIGDRFTRTYSSDEIRLDLEMETTRVCLDHVSSGCENDDYATKAILKSKGKSFSLEDLITTCGC